MNWSVLLPPFEFNNMALETEIIVDVVGAGAEFSVTVAVWREETTFSRIRWIKTGDETAQVSADDAFAAISS
jgi:hypothetical protein